jgi:hypothetical protein
MPMVRAMRLLNAVEAGTTSGTQLETLLTNDPGRLAELNVLMGMRGQARRMAASSTAMNAVAASSTAMNAVIASSTAMNAVIASSTAMNAVIASSTAMNAVAASSTAINAVIASSTARAAVYNSDVALTAISNSTTAKSAIRASASFIVKSISNSTSATTIGFTGNVIMIGFSSSNANGATTITGRRAGSAVGLLNISAGQTPINSNATFDNVMALTASATTQNGWSTSTHYFGVLPV